MKIKYIAGAILFMTYCLNSFAGGAIVAGGKTNSAVVIYEDKLDEVSRQLILNEIGKQLALGKISGYGLVSDQNGNPVRCAAKANCG